MPSCKKKKSKRFLAPRILPPYVAKDCQNEMFVGTDNEWYISKKSNNKWRWVDAERCKKKTSERYLSRVVPPYVAKDCQKGEIFLGADKKKYISVKNKTQWRWVDFKKWDSRRSKKKSSRKSRRSQKKSRKSPQMVLRAIGA